MDDVTHAGDHGCRIPGAPDGDVHRASDLELPRRLHLQVRHVDLDTRLLVQ